MIPRQIADAVAVRVREGARVDLVQHAVAPPRSRHGAAAYGPELTPAALLGWNRFHGRGTDGEEAMSTIASVAALAGVGVGTVSRVLNDSPAVSGSTRMRVLEAIEALDYEPSAAARALSTGRTSTIGVLAPFFTEPSVVERLRGVTRRLASSGYQVTLFDVERPEQGDAALRSLAVKGRVDGLLVVSLAPDRRPARAARAAGVPVVLVDRRHEGATAVFTDDEAGGRLATEHLLRLGHERIAFVGDTENGPFGFTSSEARRRGYEAALRDAGVAVAPRVPAHRPAPAATPRAPPRRELLALAVPPTAIFAASDHQALGVIEAATMAGRRRARAAVGHRLRRRRAGPLLRAHHRRPAARGERNARGRSTTRGTRRRRAALAGAAPRAPGEDHHRRTGGKQYERRGKPSYAYAPAEWHDARAQAIRGGEHEGSQGLVGGVPGCRHGIRGRRVRRRRRSSGGGESSGQTKGAKAIDVASMDDAKGDVTYCTGKDTVRRPQGGHRGVQQGQPGHERQAPGVPGVRRRAAQPVHPAPATPSRPTATASRPTSSGPPSSRPRSGCST